MAARFWVGGSGTWDGSSTANWAATSGGASGASAPTTADTVTFDANSGTAAVVTVAATAATSTCTVNKSDITLNLAGSPTFTGTFTLTAGTLSLQSFTLTCTYFTSSNTNVRTVAFGTGNITVTGSNTPVWNTDTSTNLTVTGTPVVNATYSGAVGTRTLIFGSTAAPTEANSISINVTAGSDTLTMYGAGFRDINLTGFTGTWGTSGGNRTLYGSLTLPAGMTLSAAFGQFIFAATSGAKTLTTNGLLIEGNVTINGVGGTLRLVGNTTLGTARTFTLTAGTLDLNGFTLTTGLFTGSGSGVRGIAFGTSSITVNGAGGTVWAMGSTTNLTITGTPVVNVSNNSATATTVSMGTLSEASSISFNFTTGAYALTFLSSTGTAKNIDFTGFAGTWAATGAGTIYGNLTISTGMSLTASSNAMTFAATSGTKTITTNGKTIDFPLTFNGLGGTFEFTDALTLGAGRALSLLDGTLKLKAGTTNTVAFFTNGASTTQKFLQSTLPGSQATLTDPVGTNTATYLTLQDIDATGGAAWNALLTSGNINGGNTTGWNFGEYAASGLSRGVGLYAGQQGLWGGNSGLWGGFSGLTD